MENSMKRVFFHFTIFPLLFLLSSNIFAIGSCSEENLEAIEGAQLFFGERSKPEVVSKQHIHTRWHYSKAHYTIKATNMGEENTSEFYYYETRNGPKGPKPAVVIFSSVTGVTILERRVAAYLAKKGISSFVTDLKNIEDVDTLEKVSPFMIKSLYTSLNIFDFAAEHPNVDASKMSTIGVSLGGFRALYLTALESRVKSATLVVSGTSIPDTLSTSTLDIVNVLKEKQMRALHLDPNDSDKYRKLLEGELQFDVKQLLCQRKTDEFLLFQSKNDTIVPYQEQESLYQFLGKPKRTLRSCFGHRGTAVMFGITGLGETLSHIKSHW